MQKCFHSLLLGLIQVTDEDVAGFFTLLGNCIFIVFMGEDMVR